ncbi:MAG: branched-chain amino acid ABC transporter permease [Actinomycetota bacterium]|nr:branched-chain amino acid ABC transporter permease [Actinomycetota bacterium]
MSSQVVPLLLSGVALGSIYAIVALGFVLVIKATGVLNFAHGYFLMFGGYLAVTFLVRLNLSFLVGMVLISVIMALYGVAFHYGLMQWMIGKPFFSVVLVTVGMEILIRAGILVVYGPVEFGRLNKMPEGGIAISGTQVSYVNMIVVLTALVIVGGFFLFFRLSRMGLHMRAVADNLEASAAVGITPNRVYAVAWALGLVLAGIGGVLYGHFHSSVDLGMAAVGLRAFPAAILGGIDSVHGAIIGGIIVGIVEALGAGLFGAQWRDVIAFGIMFLVLLWRPSGLFGSQEVVRV